MKFKLLSKLVFIGLLCVNSLNADENGWFFGVQWGVGGLTWEIEHSVDANYGIVNKEQEQQVDSMSKIAILWGYKQFFTPKFALRYYGTLGSGTYHINLDGYRAYKQGNYDVIYPTSHKSTITEYDFKANVDILWDFISNESWDLGVFAGFGAGYIIYQYNMRGAIQDFEYEKIDYSSGFDINARFGFRTNIAKKHGIELMLCQGLIKQKAKFNDTRTRREIDQNYNIHYMNTPSTITNSHETDIAIRYVYSF